MSTLEEVIAAAYYIDLVEPGVPWAHTPEDDAKVSEITAAVRAFLRADTTIERAAGAILRAAGELTYDCNEHARAAIEAAIGGTDNTNLSLMP